MSDKKLNFNILIGFLVAMSLIIIGYAIRYFFIQNTEIPFSTQGVSGSVYTGEVLDDTILQPIDEVYAIINDDNTSGYKSLTFPDQGKMAYTSDGINSYLDNNMQAVVVPKDVAGGYLYVLLKKPLKYIWSEKYQVSTLQPINIKTNITSLHQVGYRLDTTQSLGIYKKDQEFLYKLDNVPIKGASSNDWLGLMKDNGFIKISGIVSDTSGNGIEKIIFIRSR